MRSVQGILSVVSLLFVSSFVMAKEGYLLVKRKKVFSAQGVSALHQAAGASLVESFDFPEGLDLVKVKAGISSKSAMQTYTQNPNVEYAEADQTWHLVQSTNDPFLGDQWGLHNVGQTGGRADADINAPDLWDITTGSKEAALLIIDTGVDYTHKDLKNNMWINELEIPGNKIDDDGNGYIDDIYGINAITGSGNPMDDNIHGTHVAGIIAAEGNNKLGVSGVMQHASMIGCKFLDANGSGDTSDAIRCMNYAAKLATRKEKPVSIVATSNSWGGGGYSQALYDAVLAHEKLGILFIAAASNEGQNNDKVSTFPANIGTSNVISVAASTHEDQLASFSNYGRRSVGVAAPGEDILSTIPKGRYDFLSGTSMATPFVSGLALAIKSIHPDYNWIQIKNLILASGTPISAAKNTTITGRRIRAYDTNGTGALSCSNQKVSSRLLPKADSVSIKLGNSLGVTYLSINCDQPASMRSAFAVSQDNPGVRASLFLLDDGAGFDEVAKDGVYSGLFKPTQRGTYTLNFPDSKVKVTVK